MYLFHKKTKVLRVLALLCACSLGLCMTGGFQMTEAKTTYYDASAGRLHVKEQTCGQRGMKYSFAGSAHMD